MSSLDSPEEAAVVVAFLKRYAIDRAAGAVRDLSTYQAMYPRFEAAIAREFAELSRAEAEVEVESEPDSVSAAESEPTVIERLGCHADPEITLGEPPLEFGSGRTAGMRYREIGEIARGGMGSIREIWDRDLRRRLAMKVLLASDEAREARASDPRSLSRFLEEAQITSQLDHPGIVPVHELGVDHRGRVYFTMSLIRGRDFKAIIDEVHAGSGEWTLTGALGVVQRVCEAVAFANAKGVVHRDLKPSNVMVGRFGEVYVMDWGLARVLGREDRKDIRLRTAAGAAALSSIRTARTERGEASIDSPLITMDGDVVGTPAYMPPEQARGEVERVDERADVYSIGAMLYHLVTGKMPYLDETSRITSRTVLACVLHGPPRPPHALVPGVPAELVAICERAMAREPEERYANVRELGADLRAFLEMRVVQAYETGAVAELRKWVRRNKPLAAASVAAVLVLAAGLVISLLQKGRADRQAQLAQERYRLASEAVDRMLTRVGDKSLADVPHMEHVRRDLLTDALEFHRELLAASSDDPASQREVARAWQRVGRIQGLLGDVPQEESALREAVRMFKTLLQSFPGDVRLQQECIGARHALSACLGRSGRDEECLALSRSIVADLRDLALTLPEVDPDRAKELSARRNVGVSLLRLGRQAEALAVEQEISALLENLLAERSADDVVRLSLADHMGNLGVTLQRLHKQEESESAYHRAATLLQELVEHDPKKREYRLSQGRLQANRSVTLRSAGKQADAEASARDAVATFRSLCADYPAILEHRIWLGRALDCFGAALAARQDLSQAVEMREEGVAVLQQALDSAPGNAEILEALRITSFNRCNNLVRLERRDEVEQLTPAFLAMAETPLWLFRGAILLSQCARLAEKDERLPVERRGELFERHAAHALELLKKAAASGFADATMLSDAWLDPIRGREEFRVAAREIEARAGRPTER